jgi:hypothetical protein
MWEVQEGGSTWRGHLAHLRGLELVSGSSELNVSDDLFGAQGAQHDAARRCLG